MTWMSDYAANKRGMLGIDGAYSNGMINIQGGGSSSGDAIKQLALGSVFNILGGAVELAAYSLAVKGTGVVDGGISQKAAIQTAQSTVTSYNKQIQTATTEFLNKYPGASIDDKGTATEFSTLEKPKKDLVTSLEKKLQTADGKKQNLALQYESKLTEYNSLDSCCKNFEANVAKMSQLNMGSLKYQDINNIVQKTGDEYTVNNAAIEQYVDSKKSNPKEKDIAQLHGQKAKEFAQQKCNEYNSLQRTNKSILQMHQVADQTALQTKKDTVEKELNALKIKRLDCGETVDSVETALTAAKADLDSLGTKADYDAAIKNIKELIDTRNEAQKLLDAKKQADDAKKLFKSAKKNGASKEARKELKQHKIDMNSMLAEAYQNALKGKVT